MKAKKLISLIMTLVMLCSIITVTPITASAAYSAIEINVAPNPCYANRSSAPLPDSGTPTQGDTYYLNLAATTDYKLAKAEFYAKAPGETAFTCIYRYEPSGYFRWVNCSYTFASAGYYEFRIDITTTSGVQGSAGISTNVAAKQSVPKTEPTTYSAVEMNVSSQPCKANLSASPLPEYQIPSQGDTYYLNLACTTDFKLDHAEFYVKAPGQNEFTLVYQYNPNNYFRWVNHPYRFAKSGTYTIRTNVTATNGAQGSSDLSFDVAANEVNTEFTPVWPCESANYISTMYRYWNSGNPSSHGCRSNKYNAFDVAGSYGEKIYAVESGTVVQKNYDKGGFGYYVVIEHDNGLRSLYGHMKSESIVNVGDKVAQGQEIGYMGYSGNCYPKNVNGTHLHFEMYNPDDKNEVINPWTSYYQGNVNVTVGGNSYKANSGYTNDTYAVEWCNWLKNSCTMNNSGDYVFTVGSSLVSSTVSSHLVANTCDYIVDYITGVTNVVSNKDKIEKFDYIISEVDVTSILEDVFLTNIENVTSIGGYKIKKPN